MFIFALTPIIATSFPALAPIILAAGGALGYKVMVDMKEGGQINRQLRQKLMEETTIRIQVEELVFDSMEQEVRREEALFLENDGITIALIKDERNRLRITASGPKSIPEKIIEKRGREFAEQLAQMFAQHRAVEQLEHMNAEVAEEELLENGDIRLKISRWV